MPAAASRAATLVQVRDDEARMRLARRREGLLDADVQLLSTRPEPAAAADSERLRLRKLLEPEQLAVERARLRLAAGRGSDLHVVDSGDRHLLRSTIARVSSVPPRLEDTLVTGYTRLASDTPHRRIDAELRTLDILFSSVFLILLSPVRPCDRRDHARDERSSGALSRTSASAVAATSSRC